MAVSDLILNIAMFECFLRHSLGESWSVIEGGTGGGHRIIQRTGYRKKEEYTGYGDSLHNPGKCVSKLP